MYYESVLDKVLSKIILEGNKMVDMARPTVREENLKAIKEELDYNLADCSGAPPHIICEIVLYTLDTAQSEGRINSLERVKALDYLEEVYGYGF